MRNKTSISASALVLTDADNTLWDTNRVYADAQLSMLRRIEDLTGQRAITEDRLQFVREVDQELARTHHRGLRYPPTFLATALSYRLQGVPSSQAARKAWKTAIVPSNDDAQSIERDFLEALQAAPALREGVNEGLRALKDAHANILVITEGSKQKCSALLEQEGIANLIDFVVESPKTLALFRRLAKRGKQHRLRFMIGDQLDRDILPANEAGFTTIYFPGGFRPSWTPRDIKPDYSVNSFNQAARIIISHISEYSSLHEHYEASGA